MPKVERAVNDALALIEQQTQRRISEMRVR
jgi:hypothetical protein